ncbi:MAG: ferredoxin family protein [Deltaproteobacteria bacterium CG_4_8_14_3_um_filter_45_9]|nr:MAG: ferredoxin family protein [Deltaproteobacteria bacterium CG03_land_8_20_14_0_80_45_14]PIX23827.1 MAG: ferredoxin family protein [Deltaproteobacteria bacterium CG_4_8_14_3_um_filter_45_9]
MKVEEKLALNKFDVDKEVHITVNEEGCRDCELKPCLYACPADCFVLREDHITFSYEGCLECGSCQIACAKGAISWTYPRGGFGVCYQYG